MNLEDRMKRLEIDKQRTYINVPSPSKSPDHGRIRPGSCMRSTRMDPRGVNKTVHRGGGSTPTLPAIPQSTDVKYIQEPSYSTLLQLQANKPPVHLSATGGGGGVSAQLFKTIQPPSTSIIYDPATAAAALYANYSNLGGVSHASTTYSELEALRDPDEYTSPPSPVSSSYSELRQTIPRAGETNYSTLIRSLTRRERRNLQKF